MKTEVRAWHPLNKEMIYPKTGGNFGYGDYHSYDILRDFSPENVMMWSGMLDKNGAKIYDGDILLILTESGRKEQFTCVFGVHRREMASGYTVDIPSFSFVNSEGFPTFPIVENYMNGHDLEIIEVIGNTYETTPTPTT